MANAIAIQTQHKEPTVHNTRIVENLVKRTRYVRIVNKGDFQAVIYFDQNNLESEKERERVEIQLSSRRGSEQK